MHSCLISYIYIYIKLLLKPHFQNSLFFKVKSTFEPNVFKWIIKKKFINSSPFAFIIINVKILSNFQKEWCTFGRKKEHLKKTKIVYSSSFVSNLEHVSFAISTKYSKNNYDNPNHYVSLVIFQTYKNVVLKCVHSFGWFLWLWFYHMFSWKVKHCGLGAYEEPQKELQRKKLQRSIVDSTMSLPILVVVFF
jgi:hypothetical protein